MQINKKTVLLIKGASQYNAMRNYLDEIAVGFQQMGYVPIVVDALDLMFQQLYSQVIQTNKIDIVFTCNAILYEDVIKIPEVRYVTYLCDHPSENRERLQQFDDRAVVFVCDQFHLQYLRQYYPNIKNACFIPLSGSYSKTYIPYAKRNYDVVFTGSYVNPQALRKSVLLQYEGVLGQFVQRMVELIERCPRYTKEECLATILEQFQVIVSDDEFDELADEFFSVTYYARFYYRDQVIRTLVENGIEIHVFGNGWDEYEGTGKEILIWEHGDEIAAREAVADAYISLNVQPWFKAGFQERIATAMLSGTVALTDESKYINENFTEQELCIYSLEHLEKLPEMVQRLLQEREYAACIADNGRKRAHKELTWQHRTKEMIAYIESINAQYQDGRDYIG